ncbi:hypothetical protein BDZ97DRAFT_1835533 [Flammula alnicola]|nr:hypothetical protein BDZ97DRAFT_1835533 [Flammula alnicola]
MPPYPLEHTRAHTTSPSLPSALNRLADHIASQSQRFFAPPPAVPVPTFSMDPYTPYSESNGYIESNITLHIDNALTRHTRTQHPSIAFPILYDTTPPPPYPYTHAASAYSATIQLYSRSAQLDSAYTLSNRFGAPHQPWCRFGCHCFETAHHIFTECPRFSAFRQSATETLRDTVTTTLETFNLDTTTFIFTLRVIDELFADSPSWPTARSLYYLGVIPPLSLPSERMQSITALQQQRLCRNLAHEFHFSAIHLTARIWGIVRRTFPTFSSSSKSPKTLTLPNHLSHIISSSSSRLRISYV